MPVPLLSVLPLFLLLPLSSAGPHPIPLFASCAGGQRCEPAAVCRFNICLPPNNPVPVYAHGNRTFTLQMQPKGGFLVTQMPKQVPQAAKSTVTVKLVCQPNCKGTARCIQGSCHCVQVGVVYSPIAGCVSLATGGRPMPALPVAPSRAVPQVLPGEACVPGAECTGGSVCNVGICTCPPELVQQGGVCVSPAIMGLPHRGLPGY